ncbi:MAG: hypothetical protein AAF480_16280 [Actinomycetota bacterium]
MTERQIEKETYAVRHESGLWANEFGALGPYRPGVGPRSNPKGWFPTGPDVGERLPDIVATSHTGDTVDVHALRGGGPAVVVFYRSAVW